ncbi:MAG: ATP cone domain-containing protein [Anaerolineaceae bacterium]|nr:ATP cone domain-containing protein [Anaerolineaceae bacterium]MDD4042754.1 ATP cone domain-containing protein [Anaerolineaceae bacterium]MDD4577839.1 ATP cone domain-containing protein [Anaerolineaceae bacterium]
MSTLTHVIKRDGSIVPFTPQRITNAIYRAAVAVDGRDRQRAENLSAQVVAALEETVPEGEYPTIETIQDMVEKVLIENGHARVAKAYILYRDERARQRAKRSDDDKTPSGNIPWAKLWLVLDWSASHEVHTSQKLNQQIREGKLDEIVTAAEAAYSEDVENAANLILNRRDEVRVVFIAGPSSSGKTTTTIKIGERLARQGFKLITLNIDHYFFDLEMHPKDEFGDYDFETPQALNMSLINQNLTDLFAGKEVRIPFYDFKTGRSVPEHTPMRLNKNEIVLIDSLHGLYPEMTEDIPEEWKFKLYIEPLLQLKLNNRRYARWTDIRLMRRMLRDASHRAYDPTQTLLHWHYVRSSELRHIIPYANTVDTVVNSAMPYELPIYKAKLGANFARWAEEYQDDPLRKDAWERADRVNRMFQEIDLVEDDSFVPEDSVIREFIGGGVYKY